MSYTVSSFSDKQAAAAEAGRVLTAAVSRSGPVLLLVSGGSAFTVLDHTDTESITGQVTIGVLDERFSTDPAVNNFSLFTSTAFYRSAVARGASVIDTSVADGESLERYAARFGDALTGWMDDNPAGRIVITQGMGPDGHTAGIMPFPEDPGTFTAMFDGDAPVVVGYDAEGKNPYRYRATVTLPFLRDVDVSVCFVCGEDKRAAMDRLTAKKGTLPETPARIMRDMRSVSVFTDLPLSV